MQLLALLTFVVLVAGHVEGVRILAIFPFPGPSQYILVQPYLKALAARGHELTVINAFPQKQPVKNFHDLPVMDVHKNYDEVIGDVTIKRCKWEELKFLGNFFNMVNLNVLNNKQVQKLLHSNEHFDLVICETVLTDSLYGFAAHFNAPIIGVSSFGTDMHLDELVGNVSPLSYIPLVTGGFTDRMNFAVRLRNLYLHTMEWFYMQYVYLPLQVAQYKQYFPNPNADLLQLRKNFSLMLLNQHFSLSFPRPYVPNMIEVGGFHLNYQPAPLPADMESFIAAAKHGVIYFSMGSNVQVKELPVQVLEMLMECFAALPQSVMLKYEDDELPNKPKNVFISKWYPQPDILAHPNVKLFITHGGLLSTIESIYHGKPVLGIPMFYDQFMNVERAKAAGYGLGLEFKTSDSHKMKATIEEILHNPKYTTVAATMSKRYRDQPMKPLDVAIYWTEYVIRHDGAHHMRVSAQDLNFIQYHNLDAIFVLYGSATLAVLLGLWALLKVVCVIVKLLGQKSGAKVSKRKQH